MIRLKIISIDPGGHTGWAIWNSSTGQFSYGQLNDNNHHLDLWNLMAMEDGFYDALYSPEGNIGNNQIICERFDHRNNPFADLISKEYIGVVRLYELTVAQSNTPVKYPVIWVGSDKMKWATDEKLDALKLMIRPKVKNKDALAAMRHLVGYICNYAGTDPSITRAKNQMLTTLKEAG